MSKHLEVSIEDLRREIGVNEDGTMFWKVGRQRVRQGSPAFATENNGYRRGMFRGVHLFAHRVAWALHYGRWPELWLDHINRDKNDNRVENLREVSAALSNHNRKGRNSRYLGVTKASEGNRFVAQIQHLGQHYYLGLFEKEEDAARARDAKARELYGDDANLNFP